jgi:hypothetical protein
MRGVGGVTAFLDLQVFRKDAELSFFFLGGG